MELKYKINSRILLLAMLGAIMTCTSYLMFVYDPLQLILKKIITLSPGTMFFNIWSEPPFEVFIDVYIYNVTNSEEFLQGTEKLKLKEMGPYVYQERLLNTNATFNDNGTMTFYPRRFLSFRPDLSIGNPDLDSLISPNIPLLGIQSALQSSMVKSLSVASISNMVGSKPFLNLTVSQYLWGYDDRLVTLANNFLPNWINFDRFGILDRLMDLDNATNVVTLNTHPERVPASTILKPLERMAANHIHTWNGSPGLKHWGYKDPVGNETVPGNTRCNTLEGAFDGTLFPPKMSENATYKVYRRAFCRPVPFNFETKAVTKDGFEVYRFRVDKLFLATPEENPENACYCPNGKCLAKGLGSLSPCYYDIPIAISQPHFLNSDPALLEQVEGLKPDAAVHDSTFDLHPSLGIPLDANLKIQINLDVGETRFNAKTKPFNGIVLPLFWLGLRVQDLPMHIYLMLTMAFHVLPAIQIVLIYLLGLGGLAMISGSAFWMLFITKDEPNGRLSFRGDYSPIPIIPINSQYFKPEIRILK